MQTDPGQENLSVMIIGGSGGIGRAVARSLAPFCRKMLIHGGHSLERLESLQTELKEINPGITIELLLLPFRDFPEFLAGLQGNEVPDVLIVSFGPIVEKKLEDTSPEDWVFMTMANLALPGVLISHYAPLMAKKGGGKIILFGSTGTQEVRAYREIPAYAAAKTGLGVLVKSSAMEFGAQGVVTVGICPGYVETEYINEDRKKRWSKRSPGGKMQTPAIFGKLILEILNMDDTMIVNGSLLIADDDPSIKTV